MLLFQTYPPPTVDRPEFHYFHNFFYKSQVSGSFDSAENKYDHIRPPRKYTKFIFLYGIAAFLVVFRALKMNITIRKLSEAFLWTFIAIIVAAHFWLLKIGFFSQNNDISCLNFPFFFGKVALKWHKITILN